MPELNKDEYGKILYVNFNEDISSATAFNFILEPETGEKLERSASDGVAVGTVNIDVADESYLANQYISYTIKSGDLDKSGKWRYKAEATLSATNKLISDYQHVDVLE